MALLIDIIDMRRGRPTSHKQNSFKSNKLLCLLDLRRSSLGRLRVEPHDHKSEEPANNRPQSRNPNPTATNPPASGVLIVSEVADSDLMFLFDIGKERSLVVNTEGEDSVLVGDGEARAIYSAVLCAAGWSEV